jgi:hypothetical protein
MKLLKTKDLLLLCSSIFFFFWKNKGQKSFFFPIPILNLIQMNSSQDKVNHLNKIAETLDFMYKNFLKNRKISKIENLLQRLKPIFLFQKFEFSKELYLMDLKDSLDGLDLEIQIKKDQIEQIMKRIPLSSPFLTDRKYSPYFWILTTDEYQIFRSTFSDYLNLSQLDEYLTRRHVRLRYFTLLENFKNKVKINLDHDEMRDLFADWCHQILSTRSREGSLMIQQIRKEIRNFQRERSKITFQMNKLKKLKLFEATSF